MKKFLKVLSCAKYLLWIFAIPAFIIKAIIGVYFALIFILQVVGGFLAIPLDIVSDWLYFVKENKWSYWGSRAVYVAGRWFEEVRKNIKSINS